MDADRRVSASFEATSHLLTVERPEHGRVTGSGIDCGSGSGSDCAERLAAGATARLSAAADANHRLLGWTGACAPAAQAASAQPAMRVQTRTPSAEPNSIENVPGL